ncbi:MAG: S49 family peptidase [Polyangiales bacterium]
MTRSLDWLALYFQVAIVTAICAVLGGCTCNGPSERSVPTNAPYVAEIWLNESLDDRASSDPFAMPVPTLFSVLDRLRALEDDANLRGLFLRVGPMGSAWGSVYDLIDAVNGFRSRKLPVYCHFENADNVAYIFLGSACDALSMTPGGTLDLVGPAAQMLFFKPLLDRIGLNAEIVHVGRYKGAGDMFVRDSISPEARESTDALLDGYAAALRASVGKKLGQNATDEEIVAAIDNGPYPSEVALASKLVDNVGYLDEFRDALLDETSSERATRVYLLDDTEEVTFGDLLEALGGSRKKRQNDQKRISVVYVAGEITDGDALSATESRSGPFIKAMNDIADDDNVRGVVLRINSPGFGSCKRSHVASRRLVAGKKTGYRFGWRHGGERRLLHRFGGRHDLRAPNKPCRFDRSHRWKT